MSYAFINSKGEYILEVAEDVYFDATPVAELKRERIIKLLEESMAICAKNQHENGCDACYGQRDAIALIKGEN